MSKRTAFFVSDSTGITAQTLGQSLLAQFKNQSIRHIVIPYVDSEDKAREAVKKINKAYGEDGLQPIVFDTIIASDIRKILATSSGHMIDILSTFLKPLENLLQSESSYTVGKSHGNTEDASYRSRINAVHYALDNDDGARTSHYEQADLILVGVSRCGKTPTCLYMALQFGIYTANYPLTEDDLENLDLPKSLLAYKHKLFGLTIEPNRLHAIRSERRQNSRYASIKQCEYEVREVEATFRRFGIPFIDTTHFSIEEISAKILDVANIDRR